MPSVMKLSVYRGGVVTFRIPADWREEYSDTEGGTFSGDDPDSGTLRLRIITMTTPKQLQSPSAMDMLQVVVSGLRKSAQGTTRGRQDGNALLRYEEAAIEHGMKLTIFYWVVANPVPPRHARVATFSYTILAKQRKQIQVQRDLEMLETEIESAKFSPEVGLVSE